MAGCCKRNGHALRRQHGDETQLCREFILIGWVGDAVGEACNRLCWDLVAARNVLRQAVACFLACCTAFVM